MENQENMSKSEIESILENERKNFRLSEEMLGRTYELVGDFLEAYLILGRMVRLPDGGDTTPRGKVIASALHLMSMTRIKLAQGVITLMKGYSSDSQIHLRKAIECGAFAARIALHPHLADVWMNSGTMDEKKYSKYREKFTKLFPKDDPVLVELEKRYDKCSKAMHSSVFGLAGHFDYSAPPLFNVKHFDLPDRTSLVTLLYFALDSHKRLLRLFAHTFRDSLGVPVSEWDIHLRRLEAKLDAHREMWKRRLPPPEPTGSSAT